MESCPKYIETKSASDWKIKPAARLSHKKLRQLSNNAQSAVKYAKKAWLLSMDDIAPKKVSINDKLVVVYSTNNS